MDIRLFCHREEAPYSAWLLTIDSWDCVQENHGIHLKPIELFISLLKSSCPLSIKKSSDTPHCLYWERLDGHKEIVLNSLKELRPELYYEIMLGG